MGSKLGGEYYVSRMRVDMGIQGLFCWACMNVLSPSLAGSTLSSAFIEIVVRSCGTWRQSLEARRSLWK